LFGIGKILGKIRPVIEADQIVVADEGIGGSVNDPKIYEFSVRLPKAETLSIAFESSVFNKQWTGVVEFRFNTQQKAKLFYDALTAIGFQQSGKL
jgi:hypothetical protein